VKKLISIGVALALLTMAVVPAAVAADDGAGNYTPPQTYAKVPFAIIQSGLELVGDIIVALEPANLGIPTWIADVTDAIAPWTGGPLSWTVDMLGWGIALAADVVGQLGPILEAANIDLPIEMTDVAEIIDTVACGLRTCFDDECSGYWTCNTTE
jgi:hypothetical protein